MSVLAYATVETEFGHRFELHCPACGHPAWNGEIETDCPHLAFVHSGDLAEFVKTSPEFETLLALHVPDADSEAVDAETVREQLEEMGLGAGWLVLEVRTSGMACGPVFTTDVYGFHLDAVDSDGA